MSAIRERIAEENRTAVDRKKENGMLVERSCASRVCVVLILCLSDR